MNILDWWMYDVPFLTHHDIEKHYIHRNAIFLIYHAENRYGIPEVKHLKDPDELFFFRHYFM